MRFVTRGALALLLMLGAYMSVGCGDDGTEPGDDHQSTAMNYRWSKSFGAESDQYAGTVAVDESGNVVVGGNFYGTVDFGGDQLTSTGSYYDIYVAKLGSSGGHIWSKSFGDASEQVIQEVAVDTSGNVVIAGFFEGTIDFGGGALTSAGLRDVFVAKFGSDGSHLWSKHFGNTAHQAANALALDESGNVIIVGVFGGTVNFGGGTLTSAGGWDIFAAKFGPDGTHLWSKRFGDANHQYAPSVAVDGSGNVVIGGYFGGTVDFGGGALTSAGGVDVYIAKLGSDGSHLWSNRFGDADNQEAWGLAVDGSGSVIIAGYFYGGLDFGGGVLTSAGSADVFVAKFGSDGSHLWSKRAGDSYAQYAFGLAVDPSDRIFLAGRFLGTVDFGGGTLTGAGGWDIFAVKLGSGGGHFWSECFGDGDYQESADVAADASGNAIFVGCFAGTVDFGGDALTSAGGLDVFVTKFVP